jgi:hypothetical protein
LGAILPEFRSDAVSHSGLEGSAMARLPRLERPTFGSGSQRQNAMLILLRAQSRALHHDLVWYSALNGLKSLFRSSKEKPFQTSGVLLPPLLGLLWGIPILP